MSVLFCLTVPFTLSWRFFQALSTGVKMLALDTLPVRDVLVDGGSLLVTPHTYRYTTCYKSATHYFAITKEQEG